MYSSRLQLNSNIHILLKIHNINFYNVIFTYFAVQNLIVSFVSVLWLRQYPPHPPSLPLPLPRHSFIPLPPSLPPPLLIPPSLPPSLPSPLFPPSPPPRFTDHPEFKTIITVEGVTEYKVDSAVNGLLESLPPNAVLRWVARTLDLDSWFLWNYFCFDIGNK